MLFDLFGLSVNSYGASKAAAALVAGFLLVREFRRMGWDEDRAWTLVMATTFFGFVGAKAYFLAENGGSISLHHFGGSGFTWYGGFLAGTLTVLVLARRWHLPLVPLAGVLTGPLAAAYAIGRVGCFLAGDGTYGRPSDLPWAMAFPNGTVPTSVPVHPTALYETIGALLLAVVLWQLRTRVRAITLIAVYALASGITRLSIEELRINSESWLGLTQPQLWSVVLVLVGLGLLLRAAYRSGAVPGDDPSPLTPEHTGSGAPT
ncbi:MULTISPECIES: prolipoprotein diacylglyceryl transferase family protein [unclassified Nocardioides]|uniref:prolipoprotein diacylglyceryl transferase n=1 Tax=unclassified Nocardioides TaxID=2615069 RepID=UPI0002F7FA93|nr:MULTISPECIES: prolipoprotein diacylglyceryl transferase family protein [unclassified Nocardioides]